MKYFKKIIKQEQINKIFNLDVEKGTYIEIGEITSYDPHIVIPLVNLIAERTDKLVTMDKATHGKPTNYSKYVLSNRPPTFEEYSHLFNTAIEEEQFPYYMIFNLLIFNTCFGAPSLPRPHSIEEIAQ